MFEPEEYREIQSDKEFVAGVRQKIIALQFEANEEARVETTERHLRRLRLKLYALLAALNIPFLLITLVVNDTTFLFIWGTLLLSAGAVYEHWIETGSEYNGNQDFRFG